MKEQGWGRGEVSVGNDLSSFSTIEKRQRPMIAFVPIVTGSILTEVGGFFKAGDKRQKPQELLPLGDKR